MLRKAEEFLGLRLMSIQAFHDQRGWFAESYQESKFSELGIKERFVQDNISFSKKGTLRGLHYQKAPHAQGKLVYVAHGSVYDVVVDLRKDQPTFGDHFCIELTWENHLALYAPPGFAHGFLALEDTVFCYKCTTPYVPGAEAGIHWNGKFGLEWAINKIGFPESEISYKDAHWPQFREIKETL